MATASDALLDPSKSSSATIQLKNTEKRDTLIAEEKKYQARWRAAKIFEVRAPTTQEIPFSTPIDEIHARHPKFFTTMAYPYMNGVLHAGHSFTASKTEFTTGFARMLGMRALLPLGFHCTGMPIKACADKLAAEEAKFGRNFERYTDEEDENEAVLENGGPVAPTPAPAQGAKRADITKFTSSKSKAAAKTVKAKYQFQIMLSLGIPREEIHKFADANYWLEYFPPLCIRDLDNFGARMDWSRRFVTTDANPYYDAFVRWQMIRLKQKNKVQFGKRYTVYSPKDGQPCMDHDRAKGEGVGPTEYTALKLRVMEWNNDMKGTAEAKLPRDAKVYFVPATLRPETMYGQVCCFVGPKIKYGVFKASDAEYYICTKRAAWNMAFQGVFFDTDHFPRDEKELQPVFEAPGSAFIGTLVHAPLSVHTQGVRILPMETVWPSKGTGVVTSVPSDSPDDFATMRDLAKKAEFYGIKREWAELEIKPIIKVPAYGPKGEDVDIIAKYLVEKMKIQSPKDAVQLAEAKDVAYKDGFYKGTMIVGDFKGMKVEEAKPKIRQALIDSGDAMPFADPSDTVISRSADECVVAYLGQWFLNYGPNDKAWQQSVLGYIEAGNTRENRQESVFDNLKPSKGLKTFLEETAAAFEKNIDWLNQWACARTYGLGSKLPWDPQFLVESLSDSTIYMSYYTISYLLHGDEFGRTPGKLNIKPEQMIDEVWDYVFLGEVFSESLVQKSGISKADLQTMRREFEYWYPLDMRVSGKDLIQNHLTFFLYVHLALFQRQHWPRSIRSNGHLMLNGQKMSKSTGNFLTLSDAVKKFGADATRIALADAGDGIDDANFEEATADTSILRLHTLRLWIEETLQENIPTRERVIWDDLFEDEMHELVQETRRHYEATDFKLALKSGFYDFQAARDFYREACASSGIPMSRDLIVKYVRLQSLMITPIAPHWPEYLWLEVLGEKDTIQNARWPEVPAPNPKLAAQREYIRRTSDHILSLKDSKKIKKKKGGKPDNKPAGPPKPSSLVVFVTSEHPEWQNEFVELVRQEYRTGSKGLAEKRLAELPKGKAKTQGFSFVQGLRSSLETAKDPDAVLDRKLPFDELELLGQMKQALVKNGGLAGVEIVSVDSKSIDSSKNPQMAATAVPGKPAFLFTENE